jgi:hypothetical protein
MRGGSLGLLASAFVLAACSGRLQFDPRVDAAQLPHPAPQPVAVDAQPAPDAAPPEPDAGAPDVLPPAPDAMPPADAIVADVATPAETMPSAPVCPPGTNVLNDIFKKSCGSCHGAASPAKNLDLVTTGLEVRMVNKPSTCTDRPLIDGTLQGGSPSGLLFDKLSGAVTDCGVQMPAGAAALSPAEMACVKTWAADAINKMLGR